MKLHNLLLTAALFVTATAAFAAIEEIKMTKDGTTYTGYAWTIDDPKTNNITVTLTRTNNKGNGTWSYELFSYVKGQDPSNANWTYTLSEENADSFVKNGNERIYTFHIPLTGPNDVRYDVKSIGILSDKTETPASNSTQNIFSGNNDFHYYLSTKTDATPNTISYGKVNNGGEHMKAEFTFGTPLPTPVITLLIALGFGAALVLYRNRKQVKA